MWSSDRGWVGAPGAPWAAEKACARACEKGLEKGGGWELLRVREWVAWKGHGSVIRSVPLSVALWGFRGAECRGRGTWQERTG